MPRIPDSGILFASISDREKVHSQTGKETDVDVPQTFSDNKERREFDDSVKLPDMIRSDALLAVHEEVYANEVEHSEGRYSMEGIIDRVVSNHTELQALAHKVEAQRGRIITASTRRNPKLVLAASAPTDSSYQLQFGGRVTFEIPNEHLRSARIGVANASVSKAVSEFNSRQASIVTETAIEVTEVLYLQELVRTRSMLVSIAARKEAILETEPKQLLQALDLPNRLDQELELDELEFKLLQAEQQLRRRRERLAMAMGLPQGEWIEVEGVLEENNNFINDLEEAIEQVQLASVSSEASRAIIEESRRLYQLAVAEAAPVQELGPIFRNRIDTDNEDGQGRGQIGVRYETDLAIFDKKQGAIAQRASEVQASKASAKQAIDQMLIAIQASYSEIRSIDIELRKLNETTYPKIQRYQSMMEDPEIRKGIKEDQKIAIEERRFLADIRALELRRRKAVLAIQVSSLLDLLEQ